MDHARFQQFDLSRALSRVDGDRAVLAELGGLFLTEYPSILKALQEAVEVSDLDSVALGAHRLRSSVANFFADAVTHHAARIEALASTGDFEGLGDHLSHLRGALAKLHPELEQLVELPS